MSQRCVMMIQLGARRNYIYAQQLERAGLLHSLATDLAWIEGSDGHFMSLIHRAASRRKVSGVASERVFTTPFPTLASLLKLVMHEERVFPIIEQVFALALRSDRLATAEIIVNYLGNGGPFLDFAKRRGSKIATDFIITPKYLEIEEDERIRWRGWEPATTARSTIEAYRTRMTHLISLSDIYLCPSQSVACDLAGLPGFDPARVRLVPYGISGVLLREPRTEKGRVLFAGAAGLRKGLPYLAEAARILERRGTGINVVIAGAVTDAVRLRPETNALTFVGKLGREAMADEFARADVFCLPSLAEGSATVVFEALANGVPVVTTASSGSVVEDGKQGFIVPERNGLAVANAIERIVVDRDLRVRLSNAARVKASLYSDEVCGERFISVIRDLISAHELSKRSHQATATA